MKTKARMHYKQALLEEHEKILSAQISILKEKQCKLKFLSYDYLILRDKIGLKLELRQDLRNQIYNR